MGSPDLVSCGVELVEGLARRGVSARLLGSVAVAVLCRHTFEAEPTLLRAPNDIDLAAYSRQEQMLVEEFAARRFQPNKELNFLNAGRRLMYFRRSDRAKIDVFLDEFRMCHRFSFEGRLELGPLTIPLTDLLLTKLQIVTLAPRDTLDICALLLESRRQRPGLQAALLDAKRITDICSRDWGWYKTVSLNINRVMNADLPLVHSASREAVLNILRMLTESIEATNKSLRWRIRALAGERYRWYDVPEEPLWEMH